MTIAPAPPRFGELAADFIAGDDDGRPPIVFLPGLTFDRAMWWDPLESTCRHASLSIL